MIPVPMPVAFHAMTGRVVRSEFGAYLARGLRFDVVVKTPSGKMVKFFITPTTTLWDSNAKAIMIDKIAADVQVRLIFFVNEDGLNVARSIKILK